MGADLVELERTRATSLVRIAGAGFSSATEHLLAQRADKTLLNEIPVCQVLNKLIEYGSEKCPVFAAREPVQGLPFWENLSFAWASMGEARSTRERGRRTKMIGAFQPQSIKGGYINVENALN